MFITELLGRGTIRSAKGDVGTMHALGMRVELDGLTVSPYQSNQLVPDKLLRIYMSSLASIGGTCFPGVMSVIQEWRRIQVWMLCVANDKWYVRVHHNWERLASILQFPIKPPFMQPYETGFFKNKFYLHMHLIE